MRKIIDPEIAAMKRIAREFERFDQKQCERILAWLTDRYVTHWPQRLAERTHKVDTMQ